MELTAGARQRVAVLSKKSLLTHPYDRWLTGDDVVLYAEDIPATRHELETVGGGYAAIELFKGWKGNRAIDLAVMRAHEKRPFDRVVALSECDQVRAGQLRERLRIYGRDAASATAFRNKALMKHHAVRAGLDVPAFSTVEHVWDVVDFAASLSGPVVVKPVDGSGSRGVTVIANADEMRIWAAQQSGPRDESPRLIVEEYIDAPMLSVDGVMRGAKIVSAIVSVYTQTCFGSLSNLCPIGLLQLDDESPTSLHALRYAREVVAALPGSAETTSFHLEVFDHPGRGLLLCEIACRTGGGRINDAVYSTLGIDLEEASARGQAGRAVMTFPQPSLQRAGFVLVPSPGMRLRRAPNSCDITGVVDFRMHIGEGQNAARASKIADAAADLLLRASNYTDLARTHAEVLQWLDRALEWTGPPPHDDVES